MIFPRSVAVAGKLQAEQTRAASAMKTRKAMDTGIDCRVLFLVLVIAIGYSEGAKSKELQKPSFKIEYAWLSDYDGGYIAHFKIPVHIEIPSWRMALLFPERVYNITAWQATFTELTPDGRVVYLKQTQWNGHQWPGNVMDQRYLLRFNITPGVDYNGYSGPKPDIVFLDKVFLPNRTVDYLHDMQTMNFTYYSKPRSRYFREIQYSTVPATTKKPTTTHPTTSTEYNPFKNSGQERGYSEERKWWWDDSSPGATQKPFPTTAATQASTTAKLSWWQLVGHRTSTAAPKPTPVAVDCTESREERTAVCQKKKRPMVRCFLPQCADDGKRFKAVQCWRRSGYCWCVDTSSGVKMAKTMVRYKKADTLNCFAGDLSRTEAPASNVTTLPTTPSTTPYVPEGFAGGDSSQRPVFAPRNTYDYAQVIHNSHLFFEAQRSGTLPFNRRVSWRSSAHTKDGSDCGKDLSGGYYHSGDYVKFGFPTAFALTQLAWSYLEAKDAYQASWQTKFLKDTLKWGADYFIKAHTGQYVFYGQVGDPLYENEEWTRPQDMGAIKRPCYAVTSRSPGSDLAAETAAALAATAKVWIESGSSKNDPYVTSLLKNAKELFEFADKYRGLYHNSIRAAANYYASSGYGDELAWAAIWLYSATGEGQYLANAQRKFFEFKLFNQDTEFSWDRKAAGVQLLLAKHSKKQRTYLKPVLDFCDSIQPGGTATYTPYGLLYTSEWGPIRYACNAGFICMVASKIQSVSDIRKAKYRKFGEDQIDYVLGKTGKSFVIAFGKDYPTQPHHRASSCSLAGKCTFEDLNKPEDNPQVLAGAVVGGPDVNDIWMNDRTNAKTNAVSLDFNSAVQSSVAVLRQLQIEYQAWLNSQWRRKTD